MRRHGRPRRRRGCLGDRRRHHWPRGPGRRRRRPSGRRRRIGQHGRHRGRAKGHRQARHGLHRILRLNREEQNGCGPRGRFARLPAAPWHVGARHARPLLRRGACGLWPDHGRRGPRPPLALDHHPRAGLRPRHVRRSLLAGRLSRRPHHRVLGRPVQHDSRQPDRARGRLGGNAPAGGRQPGGRGPHGRRRRQRDRAGHRRDRRRHCLGKPQAPAAPRGHRRRHLGRRAGRNPGLHRLLHQRRVLPGAKRRHRGHLPGHSRRFPGH